MRLLFKTFYSVLFAASCLTAFLQVAKAEDIKIAVTTSFENSGLSEIILPQIKRDTGLDLRLIVVGTGQALKLGRAGDVDAILVHSKKAEEEFVEEGFGAHRREVMYNDFVLIGPKDDPAKVASAKSALGAMKAIEATKSAFISRGDDSGTNRKEINLWKTAGFDVSSFDVDWYRAAGAGMGATLNTASGMNAYVMSDRATWLKFKNKGGLSLLFSGDPVLFNQYAFIPINADKFPHVKRDLAKELENWLVSEKGQKMIGEYTLNGEVLFTPNAKAKIDD